jgi:hypothetical protein
MKKIHRGIANRGKSNSKKLFTSLLFAMGFLQFPYRSLRAQVPTQPSVVNVSGNQLLVQKRLPDGTLDIPRPYVMKGINWQPATYAPSTPSNPSGCFFNDPTDFNAWLQSQFAAYYATDIPLIQQLNANTVRIFSPLAPDAQTSKQILDAFYEAGIMVIMTVVESAGDITSGQYLTSVQQVMNHPAILMWSIGNEWNLNLYYSSYGSASAATTATEAAALAIKGIDSNHPVSSSLGDIFSITVSSCSGGDPNSTIPVIVSNVPDVAIWGLNVYRGQSFYNLFQQWTSSATATKPFFIGEFGVDSFYTTQFSLPLATQTACGPNNNEALVTQGSEDQMTQSAWDLGLWQEIQGQLSAFNAQLPCVGGNVFAFNNALWEVGDYNVGLGGLTTTCNNTTPNPDGFWLPGESPDNVTNEEYFGIVNADRSPKIAYVNLANFYQGLAPITTPTISYFNPPSAPAGGPAFTLTLNGSHFASDDYVLWNGMARAVTFLSSSQLQIALTPSDIAQSGNMNVYVVDPSTTGARSPLATFPIQSVYNSSAGRVSPNPWRSDRHSGVPITFDQLPPGSTVKIFTLSGRWVRTLDAPDGFANWDRKNDDGDLVASGIYLYVFTGPQGDTTRGKLAIIR